MRILILNSWYFPNLMGGAEHSVKLLAETLVQKGHTVGVFTIDSDERFMTNEIINGVYVYRGSGVDYNIREAYSQSKSFLQSIQNKILEVRNYSVISELSKVNSIFKPDIVHANCIAGISMSAIKYFQQKKIPIVYTLRDYFLDNPKNIVDNPTWTRPIYKIILSFYRFYTRRISAEVNACTSPSDFTLNYYISNGYFARSCLQKCIYNSVSTNVVETKSCIEDKKFHTKRNFMYAGGITEAKGVVPMITAFMKTNFESSLFICGSGNLSGFVEKCAKLDSRIKYLGKLDPSKLEKVYQKSDIMLVPSLWAEPFGRVVIEAAKYGLYVVGSENGGIPEIIKTLGCGCICDPSDIRNFTEILENVYNMDFTVVYNSIIKNIDIYSIDKQIDSFEKVYTAIK